MPIIKERRTRWGKMGKSHIPTSSLVDQYILTCRTEGKTFSTIRGYREKLRRFLGWGEAAKLGDFTVEMVRDYISHLQSAHKFEGHPFNPTQAKLLSQAAVRNLVIVLRSFSSRLDRELYTAENVLKRLQVPRAPVKVIEALTDEEIEQLFSSLDVNVDVGCRNAALLMLFLDTGLRSSELLGLQLEDVHLEEQWLKVMGKGQKERIVPFEAKATRLLQRYATIFRPSTMIGNQFFPCVDGSPLGENAIRIMFSRLGERAGVPRLHIQLLRHTFATRYFLNGGDVFSLQQLLGHTTLEMTRKYADMVGLKKAVKRRKPSPMDSTDAAKTS
jgi:site-specific recombinase XerD